MPHRYQLAYYYTTPLDSKRIDDFKLASGDSDKILATQFVRGWLGRNREYYLDLAEFDALSRGITDFSEWAKIIVEQGTESLPPYIREIQDNPLISKNPLRDIALPPDVEKRNINYIELGTQNLALLRVAIHYDRDSAVSFVSRIIREHFQRNWEKLYMSQVEAEDYKNWKFRSK
ncbi:MAG: transposase [Rhizonema sp. PD38]|nr:transposase [Rhizonema sp. PD38]